MGRRGGWLVTFRLVQSKERAPKCVGEENLEKYFFGAGDGGAGGLEKLHMSWRKMQKCWRR